MELPIQSKQVIFLIGNQRSGTTWLANIINRARNVALYYEPFEKGLGFFDYFPEEPIYLSNFSNSLARRFLDDLKALIEKRQNLWKIHTIYGQVINCLVVDLLYRLSRYGFSYKQQTVKQLRVINQWHGDLKFSNLLRKDKCPIPFIKETRLHLKVEAILNLLPKAKMIFLVRHPYPVIKSTINWFQKGSLMELRKKIDYFLDVYRTQYALADYHKIVDENMNSSLENKLLVHWIICNDNLFRVAKKFKKRVLLITYESLCKDPLSTTEKVAEFLDISFSEMKDYVIYTSTTQGTGGIVDTKRISVIQYKQWIKSIDTILYQNIIKYQSISTAIKYIQKEYEGIFEKNGSVSLEAHTTSV